MKRSTFLTSLAALFTIPFLSFKKEKQPLDKLVDVPGGVTVKNTVEPYIIRESYRVSAEEQSYQVQSKEEWIEEQCLKRMVYNIRNCPHLKKAKIMNLDGSMDYHYMLKLLPI